MSVKPTPVLLGADLNCYNVARAFHEEYGVGSYAFGRYAIGATMNSKIIRFCAVKDFDNPETFENTLIDFAGEHSEEKLILIGCTDDYVALASLCADTLSRYYIIPYTNHGQLSALSDKAEFYKLCDEYSLPHPKTCVISKGEVLPELDFDYPVIVKPAVSASYWHSSFDGMKKVYIADNPERAREIISRIFESGYPDRIIIQDRIPGDDSKMYVLTCYSSKDGEVIMQSLGHVLLEEHTPKGLGNHAAIITEENEEICSKIKNFLEGIGYVGFSNFDIKYDERDKSLRIFEINCRQGRSNYYITAGGHNIARLVCDDYINGVKTADSGFREIYWRYIPDSVVMKYSDGATKEKIRRLKREKAAYSSMRYKPDLRLNPKRSLFVFLHEMNQKKKFRKFYKPEKQN